MAAKRPKHSTLNMLCGKYPGSVQQKSCSGAAANLNVLAAGLAPSPSNPNGVPASSPGSADAIGLPWVNDGKNLSNPESGWRELRGGSRASHPADHRLAGSRPRMFGETPNITSRTRVLPRMTSGPIVRTCNTGQNFVAISAVPSGTELFLFAHQPLRRWLLSSVAPRPGTHPIQLNVECLRL